MNRLFNSNYLEHLQELKQKIDPICYPIGRSSKRINILPLYCGFDIETTTIYEKECGKVISHFSFMYIWQFQINDYTFIGRTLEELANFIYLLQLTFCELDNQRIIVFIHNLNYEFSFCAKYLYEKGFNTNVFARSFRNAMKWELDKLIFLDSLKLTGLSLEKLAKNYCTTQKMAGDLDYTLVRNRFTKLDEKELQYCINDVVILKEYSQYYFDEYIVNGQMPMTGTMISNIYMKNIISELKCSQDIFYMMKNCYPKNKQQYDYIMSFYSGAYTHGMASNLFEKLENGLSFDVNSEYPYVMMSKYFPMGKFRRLKDLTHIDSFLENYCCLVDCTLHNIKSKKGVTILSEHKLIKSVNAIYDNGRLYKADFVRVHITEVDIETLKMHYDFEIEYHYCTYAKRGYLPTYIRLTIATLYAMKCALKGVKGMEREYMAIKQKLNAIYGAMCTKLIFEDINYNGKWDSIPKDIDFDNIWKSKNKLPQWAVYVTAHARNLVLSAVNNIKPYDYWYTDTDSIKCKNKKYIIKMFNEMNLKIKNENEKFIQELNLKDRFPTVDFSELGQFAREDDLQYFKSLGSKRYIYTTYDLITHQTVAGLPKNVLNNYCKSHNLDIYEFFTSDGIAIADCDSEKLCSYYCDDTIYKDIIDYQGNVSRETSYGYVSLIPTTFTLSVDNRLIRLAQNLKSNRKAVSYEC